ncbi:ArsC family reductase [Asticcacaulis sp. EMRT-3]|uniref:ArsC family reductase n=1 Tax=Asticcacaulis sp. EMRT-3 TaxID=3040349 RepID=UPI0024AEA015|nr:ArsC family reductase [Asticcacaulis sp. EMRT-3]MDI7774651.1 ArsC family reductase [Asticcacaulis sp. EMRT-3]
MLTIYGIKNCDTMQKAMKWLTARGVDFRFHDYKASGIDAQHLGRWCERLGWEAVLNRSGTTFRKLPEADREGLSADKAIALMLAQPSMIRRPIFETGDHIIAGFKPDSVAVLERLLAEA